MSKVNGKWKSRHPEREEYQHRLKEAADKIRRFPRFILVADDPDTATVEVMAPGHRQTPGEISRLLVAIAAGMVADERNAQDAIDDARKTEIAEGAEFKAGDQVKVAVWSTERDVVGQHGRIVELQVGDDGRRRYPVDLGECVRLLGEDELMREGERRYEPPL